MQARRCNPGQPIVSCTGWPVTDEGVQARRERDTTDMKQKLQALVMVSLAGLGGFLLVVAAISYETTVRLNEDAGSVLHTYEVKARLTKLLATLTDAETGARGFVISGDEAFLAPFRAAQARTQGELNSLRTLTVDNPRQQGRLDTLQQLASRRLDLATQLIDLRRSSGLIAAQHSTILQEGKTSHDHIRSLIALMQQEEDRLLDERKRRSDATSVFNLAITAVGGLATLLLTAVVLIVVQRGFAESRRAEGALHRLNTELQASSERALAADRMKSVFLATMSHELRMPLNSIIGFTGVLLQELPGPLNPEQGKQLAMVRKSARHLLALINDVLDLSKIEAGQLKVACEPFDIRASVDKVIGLVTPQAQDKGLALQAHLAPDLGQAVGDERRFEQILFNLLGNAIKFTERGEVSLTVEAIADRTPAGAAAQSAVRVRVTDTGMGIKPEDLATLFRPFHQLDTGLAREQEGTGLGLAICRRLADLMGGEIHAESVIGKGSTFSFTLALKGRS